jgi:hypothetical protein
MIPIILLIVSLFQVAFCSPLAVQDLGCITHSDIKPIADNCHQVIDAFSRKCRCLPSQYYLQNIN